MFWFVLLFGLLTILAGICAISSRNIVHCALWAVGFFFGIACLFFTLRAEFIGAVQIIVYIGAIAILMLFAIMLTRDVAAEHAKESESGGISVGGVYGGVIAIAVAGTIIVALFKESFMRGGQSLVERAVDAAPNADVKALGEALMTPYVVPFEVVSVLLTAALVGAIVLALEKTGAPVKGARK
jgi:NADH-quinone oxidoreductase subunit J